MSIYADTEVKDRSLLQKLQDQLYEALRNDGVEIGYGLIAETQADWVLITKLDRVSLRLPFKRVYMQNRSALTSHAKKKERYNPQNPCPPLLTAAEASYNTIGYILDNDVFITAAESQVKRFYIPHPPWVMYKLLDKTIATEYSRHLADLKIEAQTQHKREKRKAKKLAMQKEKGTEQERQGVLEANGKDLRVGGKSHRKADEDLEMDAAADTADKDAVTQMQKLEIAEVEQKFSHSTEIETALRVGKKDAKQRGDTHTKEELRNKEDAVEKSVWDTP